MPGESKGAGANSKGGDRHGLATEGAVLMAVVLHVIPANALAFASSGCSKDVASRVRWLEIHAAAYRQCFVKSDAPAELAALPADFSPSHVLIEYTSYPRIIRFLKKRWPSAWVGVRAHNIEPLQHLDNHGWWPRRGPLWMLYGMGRLLWRDIQVKCGADDILSINDWENRAYWNRLPGRSRIEWLPYVCPAHLVPARPLPFNQRHVIACFPTSQRNRKSLDLVLRFLAFARAMKAQGSTNEFVVTGNLEGWGLPECPEVSRPGFMADLAAFAGTCRAVALLSPLGYGFKTTLVDAWAAGAHVLIHPELARRAPDILKPHLIPVAGLLPADLRQVVQRLQTPPPGPALQQELAARFDRAMQACFGRSP